MYYVVWYLLYVKHNYMFRPQMLAIFRLYNENLSISYTCICRGCVGCGGRCTCEISQVWGMGALDLDWLGTIYRQRTVPTYSYV